jgi:hypothetical protein
VDVHYRVYSLNHGNARLRNQFKELLDVTGADITGYHYGYVGATNTFVDLDRYPIPGSLDVFSDLTGGYSRRFEETFFPPVGDYQFFVNYETKQVALPAEWTYPVKATYTPRLIWKDPRYERRLYLHQDLINQITGDISIQYDATLDILVEAASPTGQPTQAPIWLRVPAIAQHIDS